MVVPGTILTSLSGRRVIFSKFMSAPALATILMEGLRVKSFSIAPEWSGSVWVTKRYLISSILTSFFRCSMYSSSYAGNFENKIPSPDFVRLTVNPFEALLSEILVAPAISLADSASINCFSEAFIVTEIFINTDKSSRESEVVREILKYIIFFQLLRLIFHKISHSYSKYKNRKLK